MGTGEQGMTRQEAEAEEAAAPPAAVPEPVAAQVRPPPLLALPLSLLLPVGAPALIGRTFR